MPEWMILEKQVRESIDEARLHLKRVFKKLASDKSDEHQSHLVNNAKWIEALDKFRRDVTDVNVNINKLNLIVPMLWRQQAHYNIEKEIEKILALDPLTLELPPSDDELALINRQEMEQRSTHQIIQRYSIGDAIRDFVQALKHFKV